MAPTLSAAESSSSMPLRPTLLNEKFAVHSYDGGAFKSRVQYDVKNVLVPILDSFHCSLPGNKFNLVLKCSEDFTLTHFYASGPGPRCTEPIKSGLVWVTDDPPDLESINKFNDMSSEEVMEVMKGLRSVGSKDEAGAPAPCVYFTTDPNTRESEVELSKWREGKYIVVKFMDTHSRENRQETPNIDVGIIGLIGYFGRRAPHQRPLGPWMKRTVRQVWVHPSPLKSIFSSSGWVCDGRDFTGGCRSGQTDFHQTNVYTVTFRCTSTGFDLCEKCAYDPELGQVTEASLQADLEALSDPAMCKLAVTRLKNQWRRNWLVALPKYFRHGLLDVLITSLQKNSEASSARSDEEHIISHRPLSGAPENQKRQIRRALLQLTTELTHRLLGIAGDINVNDLVWALSPKPEEHWDEGRVVQVPKALSERTAKSCWPSASSSHMDVLDAPPMASEAGEVPIAPAASTPLGSGTKAESDLEEASSFLITWKGQPACRVHPRNVLKMTADETIMTATASLMVEVANGPNCDLEKIANLLQQGADLMAVDGDGNTALLNAVSSEVPTQVLKSLLEHGACPEVSGRDGITPLQLTMQQLSPQVVAGSEAVEPSPQKVERLNSYATLLRDHGAVQPEGSSSTQQLQQLREAFGLKMLGSLLTLQSAQSMPVEILELIHVLLREMPTSIVKQALDPSAFRAFTALLQNFVGGNDNLSTALSGCHLMRALHSHNDPELRQLLLSHGVVRWAERVLGVQDFAQCGLYRQAANHEKVAPQELTKEVKVLLEEISAAKDSNVSMEVVVEEKDKDRVCEQEWRNNAKFAEIVDALDLRGPLGENEYKADAAKDALLSFRDLLKKSEKGGLTEERCTAYELELSGMSGHLLRFLKLHVSRSVVNPIRHPSLNQDQWVCFKEIFSEQTKQTRKGLGRLVKALHGVIETGEDFAVWRHKRERGLRALTDAMQLKLTYVGDAADGCKTIIPFMPQAMKPQISVTVEPLVPMSELSRYILRVTPQTSKEYLAYCREIVGATISDQSSGASFEVVGFEILLSGLPLPIHTIKQNGSDEAQRVLLAMREHGVVTPPANRSSFSDFHVLLDLLCVTAGTDAYTALLDALPQALRGEPCAPLPSSNEGADEAVQQTFQELVKIGAGRVDEALSLVALERARITSSSGAGADSASTAPADDGGVDATMRVHTVMIVVSDEIPFELFWPMVQDDIIVAVRELFPREARNMSAAVQAGVAQNGMGPIAQRLTLEEAENLAARVGHVVQTVVTVDPKAVEDVKKEREKAATGEAIPISTRVQFSAKTGDNWAPAVVVGHTSNEKDAPVDKFDVIDEHGVLWDRIPRARVRVPLGKRESPSSLGTPIQAVLSQADLVRIREHLRRRQQEWAERHANLGSAVVGSNPVTPGSRPDSAMGSSALPPLSRPAIPQLPRSSVPIESAGASARRSELSSREGSLGDVDPNGELDMNIFDDGMGDEEYDDDGDGPNPGEDGDEDDVHESSEAGDSQADIMPGHRIGSSRGDGEGPGSMEEELRVLEQLRAMEQIISEVLDPQDAALRRPPRESSNAEDLLNAPMANLRIRMGGGSGGGAGEGRVETFMIRRTSGSRGTERPAAQPVEAMRGKLPAFVRASDSANPTSSLDHPVVERLGAADLVEEESVGEDPMDVVEENSRPPQVCVRFCLHPSSELEGSLASQRPVDSNSTNQTTVDAVMQSSESTAEVSKPAVAPISLPSSWNLLKAIQFLKDQQYLRMRREQNGDASDTSVADVAATAMGAPANLVQALQKVTLKNWGLGYSLDANVPRIPQVSDVDSRMEASQTIAVSSPTDMEVDAPPRAQPNETDQHLQNTPAKVPVTRTVLSTGLPAKKRRRMLSSPEGLDAIARDIYTRLAAAEDQKEGGDSTGPHQIIARCGDNDAVTDAVELLHLLKAQGPSLGIEPSLWVSAKLDRKLRYQLEDPLSIVSGTLPLWATTLPHLCPFLFSLKTRKMLLKYTAFGPSFAVHWTQESKVGSFLRRRATVQTELNAQTDPRKMQELSQELSNIEEHVVKSNYWLGTLQCTMVRLCKGENFLRQADAAMEFVTTSGHLLEVQFEGETGFGSAVTQSFYVEVAQMLQERTTNKELPMWVEDDDATNSQYLLCRRGLMLRPLLDGPQRQVAIRRFRFLGRVMGQALREGFICPLPLSDEFFALVLGEQLLPANFPHPGSGCAGELCGVLADFAADLAAGEAALGANRTEEEVRTWRREQASRTDFGDRFLHHQHAEGTPHQSLSFDQYASMTGLCFVETGLSGAEICPDGANVPVTVENVCEFVEKAALFWFDAGVRAQVEAFRAGLNDSFAFQCLLAFSRSELREMFCGEDRIEWDEQQLLSHLHPAGGLKSDSEPYKHLVSVLLEMNQTERARFLDFVSSCPRLPPGGIAKFHLHIFPDGSSKQGYPRSRACANQLYLPAYSSKEELQEKLHEAMHSSAGHHEQRVRDM